MDITKKGFEISKGKEKNVLMWFRSDLRLADNRALESAIACVKKNQETAVSGLIALFLISVGEWKNHRLANIKVQFIMRNLKDLAKKLHELKVPLIPKFVSTPDTIPSEVLSICKSYKIKNVFCNVEYEVNETKRDSQVRDALLKEDIEFGLLHDQCIVKPGDIIRSDKLRFKFFYLFKEYWFQLVENNPSYLEESEIDTGFCNTHIEEIYTCLYNILLPEVSDFEISHDLKKYSIATFPSGEDAAFEKLQYFVSNKISSFKKERAIPSKFNTSGLSPYIAIGVISSRQCVNYARKHNKEKLSSGNIGTDKWILLYIWRDFYRYILVAFPRVCKNQPFELLSKNIEWSDNEEYFKAWKEGKTGFPFVDAGMRQLLATGFINDRIRMVTASFLTKDLHINWQKGEEHFMTNLIDGDFASNNGGWQWSASTGTDAQPDLRVFNPTLQSKKFDPNGDYIRTWIPELKNVPTKHIHEPFRYMSKEDFFEIGYPKPIIDHSVEHSKAIKIYAKAFNIE